MRKQSGQGLIEAIFSVAAVVLVVTGIVVLLVNSIGSKTESFDRKTATEVSQLVIEDLLADKKNNPNVFWALAPRSGTKTGYSKYTYSVAMVRVTDNLTYPNCNLAPTVTDCAEAVITINWQGADPQSVTFRRFFSR